LDVYRRFPVHYPLPRQVTYAAHSRLPLDLRLPTGPLRYILRRCNSAAPAACYLYPDTARCGCFARCGRTPVPHTPFTAATLLQFRLRDYRTACYLTHYPACPLRIVPAWIHLPALRLPFEHLPGSLYAAARITTTHWPATRYHPVLLPDYLTGAIVERVLLPRYVMTLRWVAVYLPYPTCHLVARLPDLTVETLLRLRCLPAVTLLRCLYTCHLPFTVVTCTAPWATVWLLPTLQRLRLPEHLRSGCRVRWSRLTVNLPG